jgi:flavin-dependent dehydrogenase
MTSGATQAQDSDQGKAPVRIVGGGPAGLACAIVLARAGYAVIVHEQRDHVGGRFHGDFQGLENWSCEEDVLQELAASGIGSKFDYHPVTHGTAFDAWGGGYEIKSAKPLYYLVRRGWQEATLDHSLLQEAQSLGVEVRFRDRVSRIDGPAVLAGGPRVADAIAVGYVFDTDMDEGDWIWFDNDLAPLGYAYLLVHGGRGTVASCMFTDFKSEANYVERTVAAFKERVGLKMRNERRFGGYANFRLPRTAVQGGHLVIGEQAGFQDALAGFGMRYALRSGILAARSIIEGRNYTALWRREVLILLQTGIANRFLFNSLGNHGSRWVLAHWLQGVDAREALRRLCGASSWTRVFFPVARWRYRGPLKDQSCDHVACSCVWCRCAAERAAVLGDRTESVAHGQAFDVG